MRRPLAIGFEPVAPEVLGKQLSHGQLGRGPFYPTGDYQTTPQIVDTGNYAIAASSIQISAGNEHTCAIFLARDNDIGSPALG